MAKAGEIDMAIELGERKGLASKMEGQGKIKASMMEQQGEKAECIGCGKEGCNEDKPRSVQCFGNEKRLLTVNETAQYLGIAVSSIYNRISRNAERPFPVRPKRIGKCVRFDKKDLDRWIDSLGNVSSGE